MDERRIERLKNLARNRNFYSAEFQSLLMELISSLRVTNECSQRSSQFSKTVHVYCREMETPDGAKYYHPVVITRGPITDERSYTMLAGEDQFVVQEQYGGMMNTGTYQIRLLTIPKSRYMQLEYALKSLIGRALDLTERYAEEAAILVARGPQRDSMKQGLKQSMMMELLRASETSGECLTRNLDIVSSRNHEYTADHPIDDFDDLDNSDFDECDESDEDYWN